MIGMEMKLVSGVGHTVFLTASESESGAPESGAQTHAHVQTVIQHLELYVMDNEANERHRTRTDVLRNSCVQGDLQRYF